MKRRPPDRKKPQAFPVQQAREAAKRAALNALKRARRTAEKAGVDLSDWEGEFLGSVEERIKTYGRAFADPDKGAMGAPLSMMQGRKLREITAKASGKEPTPRFGRRRTKKAEGHNED